MRRGASLRASAQAAAGLALMLVSTAAATPTEPYRAAHALARGIVLTASDIANADAAAPIGWITRRVIREGEILRAPAIGRLPVIRAGHPVRALHTRGHIRIIRSGLALTDAALGDTVMVRLDRQTSVPALVLDSATVQLLTADRR